ncbi:DUF393 domain-containing protein [Bacillus sp. Bva_UNVM-123]|uniref:thiol-disulfide oxidoreductase DCC family protein n=1 Tax=Bacillus sp. Bva_UNVM-123 TaxID=2829798 RepID=UPI00391EE7BE
MKTLALYDNTCSLCKQSKRVFQKLDWLHQVKWVSLQEYEQMEEGESFNKVDLRRELHIITSRGKVLKGYNAIRYLFVLFPATAIGGVILFLPFTHLLGNPIYKRIAKNRHRFLRKKCDDGSCSL